MSPFVFAMSLAGASLVLAILFSCYSLQLAKSQVEVKLSELPRLPLKDQIWQCGNARAKIRMSMPRLAGNTWEIPEMPCTKRS